VAPVLGPSVRTPLRPDNVIDRIHITAFDDYTFHDGVGLPIRSLVLGGRKRNVRRKVFRVT
jgi:hypothetical protein